MKITQRILLLAAVLGIFCGDSFAKAFGPRAASPEMFSATNAAWYSLAGAASDNTYKLNAGNVTLIADQSGNSPVNLLALNGATGNYASTPDSSFVSILGDIDIRVKANLPNWTPAALSALIAHSVDAGNQRSMIFGLDGGGNHLVLYTTATGLNYTLGVATSTATLTSAGIANFATAWVRATRAQTTGVVTFYTSLDDAATWQQLGSTSIILAGSAYFDSTAPLEVGTTDAGSANRTTGNIYRAQLYNGIAGTLAFDANFTLPAKLAASFTESSVNAATVTINTSGDLGARISGARDLVQLTAAKQPAFSVVGGYNTATFDGSNDYMKAAAFSYSQPESVYFVGSQVTWTVSHHFLDGGTVAAMAMFQRNVTPRFTLQSGGVDSGQNANLAVNTKGVVSAIFNGASSSSTVNLGSTVSSTLVAGAANGFTLAERADVPGLSANITFNEALLRSAADDATTQAQLTSYEILKWGVVP